MGTPAAAAADGDEGGDAKGGSIDAQDSSFNVEYDVGVTVRKGTPRKEPQASHYPDSESEAPLQRRVPEEPLLAASTVSTRTSERSDRSGHRPHKRQSPPTSGYNSVPHVHIDVDSASDYYDDGGDLNDQRRSHHRQTDHTDHHRPRRRLVRAWLVRGREGTSWTAPTRGSCVSRV